MTKYKGGLEVSVFPKSNTMLNTLFSKVSANRTEGIIKLEDDFPNPSAIIVTNKNYQ